LQNVPAAWFDNWTWSLPIIILTVSLHGFGLVFLRENVVDRLIHLTSSRAFATVMAAVLAVTVLLVTLLHMFEGGIWAIAYVELGALPDFSSATLYSLSAMTTYGHAEVYLERRWQMMGALEALNGVILFGLTTAFLFSVLHDLRAKRGSKTY
jgi:hypothetical protein